MRNEQNKCDTRLQPSQLFPPPVLAPTEISLLCVFSFGVFFFFSDKKKWAQKRPFVLCPAPPQRDENKRGTELRARVRGKGFRLYLTLGLGNTESGLSPTRSYTDPRKREEIYYIPGNIFVNWINSDYDKVFFFFSWKKRQGRTYIYIYI